MDQRSKPSPKKHDVAILGKCTTTTKKKGDGVNETKNGK